MSEPNLSNPSANMNQPTFTNSPEEKIYPNSSKDIQDATGPMAPYGNLRQTVDPLANYNRAMASAANSMTGSSLGEAAQPSSAESPVMPAPKEGVTPSVLLQNLTPETAKFLVDLPSMMQNMMGSLPEGLKNKQNSNSSDEPTLRAPSEEEGEEEEGISFNQAFKTFKKDSAPSFFTRKQNLDPNGSSDEVEAPTSSSASNVEGMAAAGATSSTATAGATATKSQIEISLESFSLTFESETAAFTSQLQGVFKQASGVDLAAIAKAFTEGAGKTETSEASAAGKKADSSIPQLVATNDYLGAMAKALALLSSLQVQMNSIDGDKAMEATLAKKDAVKGKLKEAEKKLQATKDDIEVRKNQSSDDCQEVLKIVMPIACVVIGIISIVGTIFAGPSSLMLLTLMIAVTIALTVISVLDSTMGLTQMLAEQIGGPLASLVMAIAMLMIVLCTCGVGVVGMAGAMAARAGTLAGQTAMGIAKQVATTAGSELAKMAKEFPKMTSALVITTAIDVGITSGLVTQTVTEFVRAIGGDAEAAMIVSIIITVLLAILAMLLMGGASREAGDAASVGVSTAGSVVKSSGSSAGKGAKAAAGIGLSAADIAANSARSSAKTINSNIANKIVNASFDIAQSDYMKAIAKNLMKLVDFIKEHFPTDVALAAVGYVGRETGNQMRTTVGKIANMLEYWANLMMGAVQTKTGAAKVEAAEHRLKMAEMLAEIRAMMVYHDMDFKALDLIVQTFEDMTKETSNLFDGMAKVFQDMIKSESASVQKLTAG